MSVTNAPPTSAHAIRYHHYQTSPPNNKHVQGSSSLSPPPSPTPTPFTNLDAALCSWSAAPSSRKLPPSPYYNRAPPPPPPPPPPSSLEPPSLSRSATPTPAMPNPPAPPSTSSSPPSSPYPSPLVRAKANVAAMAIRNLSSSPSLPPPPPVAPPVAPHPGPPARATARERGKEVVVVEGGSSEAPPPPGLEGRRGFVDRRRGAGSLPAPARALEEGSGEKAFGVQCAACGRGRPRRGRFCCGWPPVHMVLFGLGGLSGVPGRKSTR